ncbi:MAG: hypothetical protein KDA22_02340 [Phycisphaerales bacterium]|nr:hypothetical protein [Phycisphaerales bacterium]
MVPTLPTVLLAVQSAARSAAGGAPPVPAKGMTMREIGLMLLFAASMLLVGWIAWKLVNRRDPFRAPRNETSDDPPNGPR